MRETVNRLARQLAGVSLGWLIAAVGVVLLVVGWYGISGESVVAKQLPYLASATIPGAALLIAGLLTAVRGQRGERERQLLADLHAALLEPVPEPPAGPAPSSDDSLWVTPHGSTYHRTGCSLARYGTRATAAQLRERNLEPCPVCEPPALGT